MKKILLILAILIGGELAYSQNIISIGRSLRNLRYTNITRTIHLDIPRGMTAIEVARYQSINPHTQWHFTNTSTEIDVHIQRTLAAQTLKAPETIYGPYNYVRTFSKISKQEDLISKRHLNAWKHINHVTGYNGAHHLINKYTLKIIWEQQRYNGIKINLADMQKNAPAIFHPLHGNPEYKEVFHNPIQQLHDYETYGMKVTILSLLKEIDRVGISIGLPKMPEQYILGVLKETELWCKNYNLVWERSSDITDGMLYYDKPTIDELIEENPIVEQ